MQGIPAQSNKIMDYRNEKVASPSAEGLFSQEDSKQIHFECYQEISGCINLKK
jgi:hypothetical protein